MSDVKRIKELLRERVAELAPHLFPNGKKKGNHWCVGSIEGEPGKSFDICIVGEKAGLWGDFAESAKHSRSLLDLWMHARKVDFKTALHDAADWLGVSLSISKTKSQRTFPTLDDAIREVRRQKMLVTRRDWYHDRSGSKDLVIVRFDGKEGKDFRPFHLSNDGWAIGDPPGKLPLFNLPKLLVPDLNPSLEPVFVVEGEKCVCELRDKLGLLATTSAHGSDGARITDWEPLAGRAVVILPDNDSGGRGYAQTVTGILNQLSPSAVVKVVELPGLPLKGDCVEWIKARDGKPPEEIKAELLGLVRNAQITATAVREPRIRFFAPSELRDWKPDKDIVLVGDCNIMRGETFVIAGEPGVGKSLAGTQLAVSGAARRDWFGLTVHRQFRTMIVQTENGRYRLRLEYSSFDCDEIEDFIRVSEPPPFGLTLTNKEFQKDIGATLDSFKPECVVFDPWNAAARDDKIREYAETFDALRNLLPTGSDKPALGIVAHTRKPQPNEKRTGGTGLMHLLSGSYILTSVPRCIFVMTRGSQVETDDSVVFFNPKNSNGANAPRSAWHRKLSGFSPAADFDWEKFDQPPEERKTITVEHLSGIFAGGERQLELSEAAHALATVTGVRDTSAYRALHTEGKFAKYLTRHGEKLKFSSPKSLRKTGREKE